MLLDASGAEKKKLGKALGWFGPKKKGPKPGPKWGPKLGPGAEGLARGYQEAFGDRFSPLSDPRDPQIQDFQGPQGCLAHPLQNSLRTPLRGRLWRAALMR